MAKISAEEVKQRLVQQFSPQIRKAKRMQSPVMVDNTPQEQETIEFVESVNDNLFIFKKDGSYVLSPADDTLDPIIGEFDEIPDDNKMPPCMADWFDTYSNEIDAFQRHEDDMVTSSSSSITNPIEMVDLGLSVNWANMNIGAISPEQTGDFYAWGETKTKSTYTWDNYEYKETVPESYTFLGNDIAKREYDQAYAISKSMCLPNEEQWKEMQEKCTFVQKTKDGVVGYEVTGTNGNKIFLPFSGCKYDGSSHDVNKLCYYHTSNAGKEPKQFLGKKVGKNNANTIVNLNRRTGCVIRPIATSETSEKALDIVFVDLGLSVKWANMNLGAKKEIESGDFYAWGDLEANKTDFSWSDYKYYVPETTKISNIGDSISKELNYDKALLTNDTMCIPTETQWKELFSRCTIKETTLNNIKGYDVTGPNGNKIFLPFTGYMLEKTTSAGTLAYYTSGNVYASADNEYCKSCLFKTAKTPTIEKTRKRTGLPIRPVSVEQNNVKKSVDALIPYKWGQGAPYNKLLPIDPVANKTVLTGCNSTALAQVIAYWGNVGLNENKYKRGCTKTSEYISNKGSRYQITIPSLDSIAIFDYKLFDFVKKTDFKTNEAKDAVATLLKYIGYSIKSSYSYNGTSASPSTVLSSAKTHFRLGSNAKLILASSGLTSFKDKIYDNLVNGIPVIMSGWNSKGSGGHTFICDGYNAVTDKYHFNWGWDGYYNGWFDISLLKPTTEDDFSYNKKCIINMKPDYELGDMNNDNVININDVMNLIQAIIDKKTDVKYDINSDNKVNEEDASLLIDYILGKITL